MAYYFPNIAEEINWMRHVSINPMICTCPPSLTVTLFPLFRVDFVSGSERRTLFIIAEIEYSKLIAGFVINLDSLHDDICSLDDMTFGIIEVVFVSYSIVTIALRFALKAGLKSFYFTLHWLNLVTRFNTINHQSKTELCFLGGKYLHALTEESGIIKLNPFGFPHHSKITKLFGFHNS